MPIQITREGLASVFHTCSKFCQEMAQHYSDAIEPPISIDEIIRFIEVKYSVSVEVWSIPVESQHVHGLVEIWDDRVVVFVDSAKAEDMRRYITVKELVQRIIWTPESSTDNPPILLELLVQRHLFSGNGDLPKDVESEGLAMFGAIEILFPLQKRYEAKAELFNKTSTVFAIADRLRLPAYIVEFALSDRYLGLCQDLNGDHD